MSHIANLCVVELSGTIILLIIVAVGYLKWRLNYWQRRGFPVYPSKSIFFETIDNILNRRKMSFTQKYSQSFQEMKRKGFKHFGMYVLSQPTYVVTDLDYLRNILSVDFSYFVDRGNYYNEIDDPVSAHLFALGGIKWRNLRAKLTPTFTSEKIKMMFHIMVECGQILDEAMKKVTDQNEPIDIKEVLGCFTTDIIGSCAFGLNCKTFDAKNSLFRYYGKKFFDIKGLDKLKVEIITNFSNLARKLRIKLLDKDMSDFFKSIIRDSIDYRKKNNVRRKDFLQLLIDMNKQDDGASPDDNKMITFEEIVAECFAFFMAGFMTSSTLMTFALYELAANQNIQEKLRNEVCDDMEQLDGKLTYESVNAMKYMDQVVQETLRKYPPSSFLRRVCVNDYPIPGTDLVLEKGTQVFVSVLAIHRDPEYYPNPEIFDPERFSENNKYSRHKFAYIPFGEGPRTCIGRRFGLMQSKVGLAVLLRKHKFTVSKKTQEPLELDLQRFVLAAEGGIWLNAEKI